ncbi:glycosyltransferase family 2 protein [Pseudoalteromonas nigrifaciens]|uniref:glycosyltransferase family 2 protein n=1 Tax=Pseudoalteromonas nigrifaciens TaxID=28109 RepID=UPI001866F492|nr:glycosyltransferase [Pseudoalteromonas nigrifaciens]
MPDKLFDISAFREKTLPTEAEIIENWQGDIEKPVVSVLCNTYNQATYIEDAFRGFLIQKTDFVFEVIVHDDASTDGTSDIVRGYAARYPKIFKPVIQTENQYSQGKKIIGLSATYAKGEYIAICEGDDFWIDEKKIQLQTNILRSNPQINLTVHNAFITNAKVDSPNKVFGVQYFKDRIVSVKNVFIVDGQFAPTASYFFRNIKLDFLSEYPDAPVGDFLLEVFLGTHGIYTSSEIQSVYRVGSDGSWTMDIASGASKRIELYRKMLLTLSWMETKLPGNVKCWVKYKRKTIFNRLSLIYLKKSKRQSFLYLVKSLDFRNLKFRRVVVFFYYAIFR